MASGNDGEWGRVSIGADIISESETEKPRTRPPVRDVDRIPEPDDRPDPRAQWDEVKGEWIVWDEADQEWEDLDDEDAAG